MPANGSIISRASVTSQMKALAQGRRPNAQIIIKGHDDDDVATFSTLDKIEGEVVLTANQDCRFDDIEISFEGFAKTFVENLAIAAAANTRSSAYHRFLKLTQPIDESALPQPRIAEAGREYRFPFTFVVPAHLLPHACTHRARGSPCHEAHLHLPPSMGDSSISPADDMAPAMSKVTYAIKLSVSKTLDRRDRDVTLLEKQRKLRIVPASDEAAPLLPEGTGPTDYILHADKGLKKGLLRGKLGRLSIEAAQPRALRLPSHNTSNSEPISTVATLHLRFDPAEPSSSKPPRLQNLASKLNAVTFFGSKPMTDFPSKQASIWDATMGYYETATALSSRSVENVEWTRHDPSLSLREGEELARRDSAYSSMSSSSSSSSSSPMARAREEKVYYTARIIVPVALPSSASKTWLPTFYSCLVSRVYHLELSLSLTSSTSSSSSAKMQTKMALVLPLQLSSAPSTSTVATAEAAVAATTEDAEIDGFFAPRTIAVPDSDFLQRSSLVGLEGLVVDATPVVARESESAAADHHGTRPPPPGYTAFEGQLPTPAPLVGRCA